MESTIGPLYVSGLEACVETTMESTIGPLYVSGLEAEDAGFLGVTADNQRLFTNQPLVVFGKIHIHNALYPYKARRTQRPK